MEPILGVALIYFAPLATEDAALMPWAIKALTAPSANWLCKDVPTIDAFDGSEHFIQPVLRWRVRMRETLTEAWCCASVSNPGALPLADRPAREEPPRREDRRRKSETGAVTGVGADLLDGR